jgi:hypothetical protein
MKKSERLHRHARESGHPEVPGFPGFRLALAIASLAGMTFEIFNVLLGQDTSERSIFIEPPVEERSRAISSQYCADRPNNDHSKREQ